MIPSRAQLVEAYAFYVRRADLDSSFPFERPLAARPVAIDAALEMARQLVERGIGEVPAVLYAFGRHPRCFPAALFAFTALLAIQVAHSRNLRLAASSDELSALIGSIAQNKMTPDEVTLWVDLRVTEL